MAVKIRLARRGKKGAPIYDILVANSVAPRSGRFIEKIGSYQPVADPAIILLNEDRALYWVMVGAQPTDTAKTILQKAGILFKKHLQVGVNKGAITQEAADTRFAEWKKGKDAVTESEASINAKAKEAAKAARLEAEVKVNQARIDAQAAAAAAAIAASEPAAEEASEETAPEAATEETSAE